MATPAEPDAPPPAPPAAGCDLPPLPRAPMDSAEERFWFSPLVRGVLLFVGVILPVICFLIGFPNSPGHQSGSASSYAQLLLGHLPSTPQYPFLAYSMIAMVLLLFWPHDWARYFLVRLGIYLGVLLAAGHWIVFCLAARGDVPVQPGPIAATLLEGLFWCQLAVWIPWGILAAIRSIPGCLPVLILAGCSLFAVLILVGCVASEVFLASIVVPIALCLLCATTWAVTAYTVMAISLLRHGPERRLRFTLGQLLGAFALLAADLGAWRTSFLLMLDQYSSLPSTPPANNCYVCSAAARGHPWLVRSMPCRGAQGRMYRANAQMCYLKAAELLLSCVWPTLHRACRRAYDRIGPLLAARMRHPLLADAAYLLLKPLEWTARAVLVLLLPGAGTSIRKLYGLAEG